MSSRKSETDNYFSVISSVQLQHKNKTTTHHNFHPNWYSQFKNRITNIQKLSRYINLTTEEQRGIIHSKFPFAVTAYLLENMDVNNENCPIRKQFIPRIEEVRVLPEELPQNQFNDTVVEGLNPSRTIMKHHFDTVTILLTNSCASYCRYCSARSYIGQHEWYVTHGEFGLILKYLKEHTEVHQVVLSGGDPLVLSDEKIEFYLSHLSKLSHLYVIRIETRIPVVLPQRITNKLCEILSRYHPVFVDVTFNHIKEITQQTESACKLMLNHGISVVSTTILLKDINDKVQTLTDLFYKLLKLNIKPYRIIQPEIIEGTSHFRPTITTGLRLIRQLRSFISPFAVPNYVVNTQNNTEILISPENIISKTRNSVILKDVFDNIYVYPETK